MNRQNLILSGLMSAVLALGGTAAIAQSSQSDAARADTTNMTPQQHDQVVNQLRGYDNAVPSDAPLTQQQTVERGPTLKDSDMPRARAAQPDETPMTVQQTVKGGRTLDKAPSATSREEVRNEGIQARESGEVLQNEQTKRAAP